MVLSAMTITLKRAILSAVVQPMRITVTRYAITHLILIVVVT